MAPRGTVLGVGADLEPADHATRVLRILGADAHAELAQSGWPRELPGGWGDHGVRAVAAPEAAALLPARLAALAPGVGFLVRAGRPSIEREILVSWTDGRPSRTSPTWPASTPTATGAVGRMCFCCTRTERRPKPPVVTWPLR